MHSDPFLLLFVAVTGVIEDSIRNYFMFGIFDPNDLMATVSGGLAAAGIIILFNGMRLK